MPRPALRGLPGTYHHCVRATCDGGTQSGWGIASNPGAPTFAAPVLGARVRYPQCADVVAPLDWHRPLAVTFSDDASLDRRLPPLATAYVRASRVKVRGSGVTPVPRPGSTLDGADGGPGVPNGRPSRAVPGGARRCQAVPGGGRRRQVPNGAVRKSPPARFVPGELSHWKRRVAQPLSTGWDVLDNSEHEP
jgi:hypothetical protein